MRGYLLNLVAALLGLEPAGRDPDPAPTFPLDRCEIDFRPGYYPNRLEVELYPGAALPTLRAAGALVHVMPDGRVLAFRPFRKRGGAA